MPALQMLDNLVPISDFSHGKGSAAFSKVGDDNPVWSSNTTSQHL